MALTDWTEVAESLGPISSELTSELVQLPNLGPQAMALCHWQCEPYYRALRHLGPQTPSRVVDRSGWSYRNEKRLGPFRQREFLRVEFVWRGTGDVVSDVQETLLEAIQGKLAAMSLETQRVQRDEETLNSSQRLVVDLVAKADDGSEVEVVGSHLHGRTFVRRFWADAPTDMETACMGISISRIAALLILRHAGEGPSRSSGEPE
jgi:seryl-tRNA synthetase